MKKAAWCIGVVVLLAGAWPANAQSADSARVWALEQAYWHYVQTDDLTSYRALWHEGFLGWPSMSPEPLPKQHITDWIAAFKKNGDTLQSFELEQLRAQVTGNVATTTYRIHARWLNKSGATTASSLRVIHTWMHNADGKWEIISGMSAPTDAAGH